MELALESGPGRRVAFAIHGIPPAKSNCYRIITIRGRGSLKKTDALTAYERSFILQVPKHVRIGLKGKLAVSVVAVVRNRAADLDNTLKSAFDCLERAGVIENDRMIYEIRASKRITREARARMEFEICELPIDHQIEDEPEPTKT